MNNNNHERNSPREVNSNRVVQTSPRARLGVNSFRNKVSQPKKSQSVKKVRF